MINTEEKWKNYNGNINICSDIEDRDIQKLISEKNIRSLQFYLFQNPSNDTWETLNEFFLQYPHIGLRVLWEEQQDLAFYKLIPNVRKFSISSFNTKDFSPLRYNTNLKYFGIEETKSKSVDISFIKDFKDLENLYIDGMKKGLENIQFLKVLKTLTLRGIKLENLNFISNLKELESLNLRYGSYKNLETVGELKQLKSIEFSRVRQIPNFDFLNSLENLEKIEFEGMAQMESIPNLSKLVKLKKLHINNNLRLQNIQSISEIPNLKLYQLSFAESSKAKERKEIINQSVEILMQSKTIEYTNIIHWTDEKTTKDLLNKGIKQWKRGIEI